VTPPNVCSINVCDKRNSLAISNNIFAFHTQSWLYQVRAGLPVLHAIFLFTSSNRFRLSGLDRCSNVSGV
jgi:hypothetical protein